MKEVQWKSVIKLPNQQLLLFSTGFTFICEQAINNYLLRESYFIMFKVFIFFLLLFLDTFNAVESSSVSKDTC